MRRNTISKIAIGITAFIIGTIIILPIQAKVTSSGISVSWVKKNYYSKKQSNSRYDTKTSVNSKLTSYYSKTSIDTLLADYLKSTVASATYLTQSSAASTYLTQSSASSTYLTQASATSTYFPKSGGTLTGGLTSPSYSFSSPVTKVITIPGTEFFGIVSTNVRAINPADDSVYRASGGGWFTAPVVLPDGATLTSLKQYYFDISGFDISASLYKDSLTATTTEVIHDTSSSGSGGLGSVEDTSPTEIVDNSNYSYSLSVFFGVADANLRLKAVKITYTVPSL